MRRFTTGRGVAVLTAWMLVAGTAMAGGQDTTNTSGSAMNTLEDSRQKAAMDPTLSSDTAAVAKTGLTPIMPLNPAPAGSDGALRKGVTWPNPRFKDNADGTVRDNLTGLIWLKNANAFGRKTWAAALAVCNDLAANGSTLTDGSAPGDWRLPNRKELDSLIALPYFSPALCNTLGTGQWMEGDPFTNVQLDIYWTSTSSADHPNYAWLVYLYHGLMDYDRTTSKYYVWPVRDGRRE
jgi:hypothetical protein